MKRFNKMTAWLLALAILLCAVPFAPIVVSADVAVNNAANKIATIDKAALTGTTTFTGSSADFSVNLTGVVEGVYKVAYYFTLGEMAEGAQITLKPYGADVNTVLTYEDLQTYPNGKIVAVVVIRASENFTISGSVTGLAGSVDKIVVAKENYDLGSAAELDRYIMYGEDIAENVPADYIQPGDTEWIQSIPMGLATTYNQQFNYSNNVNLFKDIFNSVGAQFYEHSTDFTNKGYFDETWSKMVAICDEEIQDGSAITTLPAFTENIGDSLNCFMRTWTGTITVGDTGKYRILGKKVDNGLYIKINGTVVYEYWGNNAYFDNGTTLGGTEFNLNSGTYSLEVYYYELGGGEALDYSLQREVTTGSGCSQKTEWQDMSPSVKISEMKYYKAKGFVADAGRFNDAIPGGADGNKRTFENNDWYDESIGTIEAMVVPVATLRKNTFVISVESDFRADLADLSFATNGGDGPDGCFVRYTGYITADEDGEYQFGFTKVDNGCVMEIGGTRVLEFWGKNTWWDNGGDPLYMDGVSVTMKAGESLPITVTYLELAGGEGLTFSVKKDGGPDIDLSSSNLVFSTMPLKGVITENIPQLEETTDRVLFHTDFTNVDDLTIYGSPAVNTNKGIMIMNSDDYFSIGTECLQDLGTTTSIEFVIKPSAIVEHAAFAGIGTNDEEDHNWVVMGMRKDGALKFGMRTQELEVGAGDSGRTQGGMLAVGTWAKVKYVFTDSNVSVYLNDELIKTWDTVGQKDLSQIPGDFVFGKQLRFGDKGFTGTVSEVRVTTTEQVLRIRDKETNLLLKTYTASEIAGGALQLNTVDMEGYIMLGWVDEAGDPIETATVGATVYANRVAVQKPISTGRQIRVSISDSSNGFRFRGTVKRDAFYNLFNEEDADYVYNANFKFGMLILPADLLPDGEELTLETAKVLNIVGKKVYTQKNEYGDLEYTGVVTDIPESQYGRLLYARPYVTYTYEGVTKTLYGDETAFGKYQNVAREIYADADISADVKANLLTVFGEAALQMQDADKFANNKNSEWREYQYGGNIDTGISWPEGQGLPIFATPADVIDTIGMGELTNDEKVAFVALQGLVNKTKPRMYITESFNDRGNFAIAPTVNFNNRTFYDTNNKYELFAKYIGEVDGLVLYSTSGSAHYRNLAATVAGLRNAIPVTVELYNELLNNDIDLPVIEDLTGLEYTTAIDIYNYMYSTYWPECTKRLILSMPPDDKLTYIRDIAAATGAAIVWLDCTTSKEQAVYEKFLKDMASDNSTSVGMGWYTEERSGIGTGTKYGIGTVPADFYTNPTLYAGNDHTIQVPAVPDKPVLENKMYIAIYISDGDNIQYNQGYMKELWDTSANDRGKIAINWTISPSLVDVGPGILNYYYTTATDKDCFVCGPSGMGYAMMIDTSTTLTSTQYLKDSDTAYLDHYTKLTGTYMERAGLRVITAWDNLSTTHRKAYEANCRYLYGMTVHDWGGKGVEPSTVNDLRIEELVEEYIGDADSLYSLISTELYKYNGSSPAFRAFQVSSWGEIERPGDIKSVYDSLRQTYGDIFEFVRADHYYALYNEANNLNYNLCLDSTTKVTASSSNDDAEVLSDGSAYTMWTSNTRFNQYVEFDLGATHSVNRYVIRFAGARGFDAEYNVRAFHVEVSTDGNSWNTVDTYVENIANAVDIDLTATNARYVRFVIDDANGDGYARIADIEIYGK